MRTTTHALDDSDTFDFTTDLAGWRDEARARREELRAEAEARLDALRAPLDPGQPAPDPAPDDPNAPRPGFQIRGEFLSEVPAVLLGALIESTGVIERVIRNDLEDVDLGGEGAPFVVDDVAILAGVDAIDGPGGTLARTFDLGLRAEGPDAGLPVLATIVFDAADIPGPDAGERELARFGNVVLHEFFHALGFGLTWERAGLLDTIGGVPRFTGPSAIDAYFAFFPEQAAADPLAHLGVPVEADGGPATALLHWDEAVFGTELMTGFVGPDEVLSGLTLASMEDLGYEVDWDAWFLA